VISIVIGFLLTKFVDEPLRKWKWANKKTVNKWVVVAVSLMAGLIPVGVSWAYIESSRAAIAQADPTSEHPGATAIGNIESAEFQDPPIPGPFDLDLEWVGYNGECSPRYRELFPEAGPAETCGAFGAGEEISVIIMGDSHAEQNLLPSFEAFVKESGQRVEAILTGGCKATIPGETPEWCAERNRLTIQYIEENQPDIVGLMVTQNSPDSPDESLIPGVRDLIENFTGQGIEVVGFRDSLRSEKGLYDCSNKRDSVELMGGCLLDKSDYFAANSPAEELQDIPGFHLIDMTELMCVDGVCPTILGNVHVYIDDNHVSGTYSRTMAPEISRRIAEVLG
jgi:Predicted acyltransferases